MATIFDENTFNEATIAVYVTTRTLIGSSVVEDRSLKVEGVDWTRSGASIVFLIPPPNGSVVEIRYLTALLVQADYAVELPFNKLDGTNRAAIDALGGFDGSVTVYNGKRILFARQEQYPGYIEEEDGWIQNRNSWDDGNYWDDPELGFDNYRIIPGYDENQANSLVTNERGGIWEVSVDDFGLIRLTSVDTIIPGQRVQVLNGAKYGGKIVKYGPLIKFDIGETVPSYEIVAVKTEGIATIFDGGTTRFVDNVSTYQVPDEGDKYLVFPRVNIFT